MCDQETHRRLKSDSPTTESQPAMTTFCEILKTPRTCETLRDSQHSSLETRALECILQYALFCLISRCLSFPTPCRNRVKSIHKDSKNNERRTFYYHPLQWYVANMASLPIVAHISLPRIGLSIRLAPTVPEELLRYLPATQHHANYQSTLGTAYRTAT